jgi:hypothetical protein
VGTKKTDGAEKVSVEAGATTTPNQ